MDKLLGNEKKNYSLLQEYIKLNKKFPNYTEVYKGVQLGVWFVDCVLENKKWINVYINKLLEGSSNTFNEIKWECYYQVVIIQFLNIGNKSTLTIAERKDGSKWVYRGLSITNWLYRQQYAYNHWRLNYARSEKLKKINNRLLELGAPALIDTFIENESVVEENNDNENITTNTTNTTTTNTTTTTINPKGNDNSYNRQQQEIELKQNTRTKQIGVVEAKKEEKEKLLSWDDKCLLVQKYLSENKGELPSKDAYYYGLNVYEWIETQRNRNTQCTITEEQKQKLAKLGIIGVDNWNIKYNVLKKYITEYQTLPKNSTEYAGLDIGKWWQVQKYSDLSKPRAEKIRAIEGFLNQQELKWERNYKLVQDYIKQYGVLPSKNTKYANVSIGRWLTNQHELVKEDNLAPDRFEKIKELDTFLTKEQKADYENLNLLEEYVRLYGNRPHTGEVYKGVDIGTWFNRQIREAREKPDIIARIILLRILDGNTITSDKSKNPEENRWNTYFSKLEEYTNVMNKLPRANTKYDNLYIGRWLVENKRLYNNKMLPEQNKMKLEGLGVFDSVIVRWERMVSLLDEYMAVSNGKIPDINVRFKGRALGEWFSKQREYITAEKLHPHRKRVLEDLGLTPTQLKYNNPPSYSLVWEKDFKVLGDFIARYKRLPKVTEQFKEVNIGNWLSTQISTYNNKTLNQIRKKQLYQLLSLLDNISVTKERITKEVIKTWEENYEILDRYVTKYKCFPIANTLNDPSFDSWVSNQLYRYNTDTMPDETHKLKFKQLLVKANYIKVDLYKGKVIRDVNTLKWDNKCEIAKEFIREFERYPRKIEKYKDNNIGDWFNRNKKEYNQGRLSEERKASFREVLATLPPEKRQNLVVTKI